MLASLGYPHAKKMATLTGIAEGGGGALLAVGLATPIAAAALIGVMVNAIFTAHAGNGPWNQNGGWEYPLVIATTSFGIAWTGPGAVSMDNAIGWNPHDAMAGLSAMALGILSAVVALSLRARRARRNKNRRKELRLDALPERDRPGEWAAFGRPVFIGATFGRNLGRFRQKGNFGLFDRCRAQDNSLLWGHIER